ncbi:exoribonuclease II, putative [Plasmodium berghei]|uniref:Exoribonuclease II, putative n=2 Tax=Plasmodium berghei TaxID=5821 RepID=A0A509AGJ6_PLABA|nr:exoribonuclease II, putative [Plasmodium berghei ANKA]CXI04036.1 exoribonuclease II, putative [Plasmodium berghei]SCL92196.1 exoribonuclease II, putative [Plasmodium berghei]SCM15613.1 exoribonuclease II, putative [Plasmodium berghei]SCM17405.1 exoribonuclease II, putative [Plasmodium berghei]SCN22685.1 exoribonuclease II, putative [Plasmodium berghei]|eukprot:XP_034420211.1 exoribonuclease II, putative [Plasmodium berghei ANKA]
MFFFKNIRKNCFYTKIYENIKILRGLKAKNKGAELIENTYKGQHSNIGDKKKIDNTISCEDNEFYKHIYSKLKEKKSESVYEKKSENFYEKKSENFYEKKNRQESIISSDKENVVNSFKEIGKNTETNNKNKYLINKRDNINNQNIHSNGKYLKRKEIYLKYNDSSSNRNKINKETTTLRNEYDKNCKKKAKLEKLEKTEEKKNDEIVIRDGNNKEIYNDGKDKKKIFQKNCKNIECNFEGSDFKEKNKNSYVHVKYEKYWSMDKINKVAELENNANVKNKVFKGVLFVSPFDTTKSFVVEEKAESKTSKIKYYNVYGYISRNRALNNDIVYAYTCRRKIIKNCKIDKKGNEENCQNSEIEEKNLNENEIELEYLFDNENIKDKINEEENFCRVIRVLERKNIEIVCNLNYLNIKEYINNLFKTKKGLNVLIEQEKQKGVFAKFQPTDTRFPCFIYDSKDLTINRILNYIKKKKKNLYVLINFRKWEENEINPTGDIISILGNEQNFFSIIYFFLYFYKINFHIYKKNEMSYLKSEIIVGNKLINTFIERKNKSVCGDSKYDCFSKMNEKDYMSIEFEKKINYLKEIQKKKKIEKYMIKSLLTNREILTHLDVFTIDPPTAKDLDDALSIQFIHPDQFSNIKYKYKIGVHISDVSFFISPNSYYDRIASTLCNTLYMELMVFHMLPSIISEDVCSLNTSGNKLSFSVFFYLDNLSNPYENIKEKKSENVEMKKCIIKSKYKLCYDDVENYIDDVYTSIDNFEKKKKKKIIIEKDYIKEWEEKILINGYMNIDGLIPDFEKICDKYNLSIKIASDIFRLYLLSKHIKNKTGRKTINQNELLMFFLNNKNEMNKMIPISIDYVKKFLKKKGVNNEKTEKLNKNEDEIFENIFENVMKKMDIENIEIKIIKNKIKSHMLIEEMMIFTNFLVAKKICEYNNIGILRIHDDTTNEIKNNLLQFIDHNTYKKINTIINIKENNINNILSVCEKILNKNSFLCLQYNILKLYKQAIYVPNIENNENIHHFGLSLNNYIHFTSPIRRYIDIITHRILNNILEKKKPLYNYDQIKKICELCNIQKKKTDDIQIHMKNFFLNKYLVYLNEEYKHKMVNEYSLKIRKNKNEKINRDTRILSKSELNGSEPIDHNQIVNGINNLNLKMDKSENYDFEKCEEKECKVELYKKHFYIYKNIISFMTYSYIHDIIVKKSVKRNICINILNDNYINVDDNGIIYEGSCGDNVYTCCIPILLLSDKKNENLFEKSITSKNKENDSVPYDVEVDKYFDEITKSEHGNCKSDEKKIKNAISFYVPLLETEKSVSENLLNLKFELIYISFQDDKFIYNTVFDILYKINSKKNNEEKYISRNFYEKEKYEEDKLKKECLNNIYKNILNIKIKVRYKILKLEKNEIKKKFQKIYDNLYVHGIYAKIIDNGNQLKKNESIICEKFYNKIDDYKEMSYNLNNEKSISKKENDNLSNMEKDNLNSTSIINKDDDKNIFFDQYKEINRFQKNKIFIIPGGNMWNLRFV